jgi:hypothetical protein
MVESSIFKIKYLYFKNAMFDEILDCTYILLCCGEIPKRYQSVIQNIFLLKPTRKVKLIFNNGFSKCKISKTVNHNLINMQLYIFNDSIKNGYKRILYLEDDFELKKKINKRDIFNLVEFIRQENPDVYGLGNFSFPTLYSIFKRHQQVAFNFLGCSHAMIYNLNYMNKYIDFIKNHKTPEELSIDFVPSFLDNISIPV